MSNFIGPQTVIPNARGNPVNGNSMASNIISSPTALNNVPMVSYEVDWMGTTPVGTVSVQGSNSITFDGQGNILSPGMWTTLSFLYQGSYVTSVPVSGNTGNGMIDIQLTSIYATRLVYTAISGTGTLTATMMAK